MPDLQRYPWKFCLIMYELDIKVFFFKLFDLRFLCESDLHISCLLEAMEKLTEMNTQKNEGIFHIFDQI